MKRQAWPYAPGCVRARPTPPGGLADFTESLDDLAASASGRRLGIVSSRPSLWTEVSALKGATRIDLVGPFSMGIPIIGLRRAKLDLVLVDSGSKDPDGLALVRHLRVHLPSAQVLLAVDDNNAQYALRAIGFGVKAVLLRPISKAEMLLAISAARQGGVYLSSHIMECPRNIGETPIPDWSVDPRLTPRETEVLKLEAAGRVYKEIAAMLHVSQHTVNHHLYAARRKLGVHTSIEAVRLAFCGRCTNPNLTGGSRTRCRSRGE